MIVSTGNVTPSTRMTECDVNIWRSPVIIMDDTSIGFPNDVLWLRDVFYYRDGNSRSSLQLFIDFYTPIWM